MQKLYAVMSTGGLKKFFHYLNGIAVLELGCNVWGNAHSREKCCV